MEHKQEKSVFPDSFRGLFSVLDFGAAGDGSTDNTAAFTAALTEAGREGGIVYAPPGKYRFEGHLTVPVGVTLMGSFGCVPAHNGNRDKNLPEPGKFGTVLMPTADRGTEDAPAFITLSTNAVLKGVLIWYPEQREDDVPYPYPWTVAMRGKNPALLDTELLNPYKAIDATENERHMIARVYGQPLYRGIRIDAIYDIGRIEDVHFNPWWSMKPAIRKFMMEQGEAFTIGRTDWEYMVNCFAIFYKVGFHFLDLGAGPGNAVLTHCGHDMAPVTVLIDALQLHAGVSFNNCQFMGDFVVSETNDAPVRLNGCGFWGVPAGAQENPGTTSLLHLAGTGHVIVNGCHFFGWDVKPDEPGSPAIDINCRTAAISACGFLTDKPCSIRVGESVKDCVIMGNRFTGGAKIEQKIPGHAQIGFNMDA